MKIEQSSIQHLARLHTNFIKPHPLAQDLKWKLENVQLIQDVQLNKLLESLENLRGIPYKSLNLLCRVILPGGDEVEITRNNIGTFFNNDSNNASLTVKNSNVDTHIAYHNLQKLTRYVESETKRRNERNYELLKGLDFVNFLSSPGRRISFDNIREAAMLRQTQRKTPEISEGELDTKIGEPQQLNEKEIRLNQLKSSFTDFNIEFINVLQAAKEISEAVKALPDYPKQIYDSNDQLTSEAQEFSDKLIKRAIFPKFGSQTTLQGNFDNHSDSNSLGPLHVLDAVLLGNFTNEVEASMLTNKKPLTILLKYLVDYLSKEIKD
ncbi:MAG: hypothetical protein QNJ31_08495 [Candidatus Caenarcaniphilales bacterium]|nr:hypothetical protein [Candidatus Caenarcaniphilales bacterium]